MAVIPGMLPSYENPPVVEVAASIQFAPLRDFTVAHVGCYWNTIRDRLDRVHEQPPVAHVIEGEEMRPGLGAMGVRLMDRPELLRTWFTNADGSELVQLQRDRFAYNWKKSSESVEYPRYGNVKRLFLGHWRGFQSFLSEQGLEAPLVDQCELTYVNLIPRGSGWTSMRDLVAMFTVLSWTPRTGFLREPERVAWQMSFQLPDGEGRLHVDASPVFVPPDNTLAARLNLTVRGMPGGEAEVNEDRIVQWFDLARTWIVKGFVDLVTNETDSLWRRRQ